MHTRIVCTYATTVIKVNSALNTGYTSINCVPHQTCAACINRIYASIPGTNAEISKEKFIFDLMLYNIQLIVLNWNTL